MYDIKSYWNDVVLYKIASIIPKHIRERIIVTAAVKSAGNNGPDSVRFEDMFKNA